MSSLSNLSSSSPTSYPGLLSPTSPTTNRHVVGNFASVAVIKLLSMAHVTGWSAAHARHLHNTYTYTYIHTRDTDAWQTQNRVDDKFRALFQQAGLRLVKTELQNGFPKDLFPVRMYALK